MIEMYRRHRLIEEMVIMEKVILYQRSTSQTRPLQVGHFRALTFTSIYFSANR
jgi:hypothetical protein